MKEKFASRFRGDLPDAAPVPGRNNDSMWASHSLSNPTTYGYMIFFLRFFFLREKANRQLDRQPGR